MNDQPQQPELIDIAKTKPLSVQELAGWFDMSRRRITVFVKSIDGAEKLGRRWRVPIREMPIEYLIDVGVVSPNCHKLSVRGHSCREPNLSPADDDA
jgi:hypothetical protein